MAKAAVRRRQFDVWRDARRFVKLTDGETLFECVGTRGIRVGERAVEGDAALKLLDAGRDWPDDPFEALDRAEWMPLDEAAELEVVEPAD